MKVVLADGREIGLNTNYELAKYILFGQEKERVPIHSAPKLTADRLTQKMIKIKREINLTRDRMALALALAEVASREAFDNDDHIPF